MDQGPELPPSNGLLSKGEALWRRSKIWAPFVLEEPAPSPAPAEPVDLESPASQAPPLDLACLTLAPLLAPRYHLRALGGVAGDRQALFEHWMGLGTEGLRTRFFYHPTEDLLRKRAGELDFANPRFAGIFAPGGELACVAEWAAGGEPGEEGSAEAAFSTLPAHRRRGLAKMAAAACAIDARGNGVDRLRIDTLRENSAAQALAASLGGARESFSQGSASDCVTSLIDLRAPAPMSIEARLGLPESTVSPARPART